MLKAPILLLVLLTISTLVHSQSTRELFEKGKQAFYSDQFEEANKFFSQILAKESNDYETSYYKALTYEINFDNDKAIAELTKAIGFQPRNSDAYFARAVIYDKQNKFLDAIQDYTSAIKHKKTFADAYFNRASDFQELKLFDEAVKDYSSVVKLNPSDDIAYYNRGKLYKELNKNEKAIEDFEEAIRIDKSWENELRPLINKLNGTETDPGSNPDPGSNK